MRINVLRRETLSILAFLAIAASFEYDDTLRTITTRSDKVTSGDNLLVSKLKSDQMGRTTEARQYEGGYNYIVTLTDYDALSRPFKSSNPYRPWQSEIAVWTTQAFDALGRVISVTTPDNAVVNTSYSGNTVTVTDQAGKARKSVTDALGRLTDVYEDPNGANLQTTYAFDVLDDLTTVTQGIQTPRFQHGYCRHEAPPGVAQCQVRGLIRTVCELTGPSHRARWPSTVRLMR